MRTRRDNQSERFLPSTSMHVSSGFFTSSYSTKCSCAKFARKKKVLLTRGSNVVCVSALVIVVDDIHASGCVLLQGHHLRLVTLNHFSNQFYDLIEIFRIGGHAPYTNYWFLSVLCLLWSELFVRAPIPCPSLVLQVTTTSIEGSLVLKQLHSSHSSSSDILIVCNSFEGITDLRVEL